VDTSDEEEIGRPSNSEGRQQSFRYSTLKRAAEDDGAGPSGITSDIVNRPIDTTQPQGIVTYNKFACLSQEEIINNEDNIQLHAQCSPRTHTHTHTRETRRKRFAKDPETETGTDSATHTNTTEQSKNTRERKPPPIYLTSKERLYSSPKH